jgi:alpha-D-ribose 1-methylphosphonate 5-triphosphate synthase subunit PhnH
LIPNLTKCEVCAVIHHQLVSVYGKDVMNSQNVTKWCCEYEAGRSDAHDEIRSGRPFAVTDENICVDRCLTIDELHQQYPEASRTVLHKTVTKRLGYRKLCMHCVNYTIMPI